MSATTPELLPTARRHHRLDDVHGAPALVLLPVPVSEPPYDDERTERAAPRLSLVTSPPPPVGPLSRLPALSEPPGPAAAPAPSADSDLPALRPVARALVQGLLEVLGGVRPVTQLRARTSPELYADLEQLVHARPRPVGTRPATGAVLSLHAQQPSPLVAEVCTTVRRGRRAAALALRLELQDGAWRCTAVSGLGPDLPCPRTDVLDEHA